MKKTLIQVASIVVFLAIWKSYVVLFEVSPLVLPPPEAVLTALIVLLQQPDTYMHMRTTLFECLGGFCIAVVLGSVLGQVLAAWRYSTPYSSLLSWDCN